MQARRASPPLDLVALAASAVGALAPFVLLPVDRGFGALAGMLLAPAWIALSGRMPGVVGFVALAAVVTLKTALGLALYRALIADDGLVSIVFVMAGIGELGLVAIVWAFRAVRRAPYAGLPDEDG